MKKNFLGYLDSDYKTPYAKFFNSEMSPIPDFVSYGINQSPFPAKSLPSINEATYLNHSGYTDVEVGYSIETDGAIHVATLTQMPNVTPEMWDWWFGWHGCDQNRYKLWHPKAHLNAQWSDGKNDEEYIGRTSIVDEYIGEEIINGAISFKSPTEFGFTTEMLKNSSDVVYICARVGHPSLPVDYGYLIHQVRIVEGGSEMRSRFWMGGKYIQIRKDGIIAEMASEFVRKFKTLPEKFAKDLLSHCAEEMNHLGKILPALYSEFKSVGNKLEVSGRTINNTDANFHSAVMATLFNKVDPGRKPYKIVEPKNVQDIINTLKYAKSNGKKVTVCSGGHSFSANHLRDNSILIDMTNFDHYEIDKKSMTAKAGPAVGGSTLMVELYKQDLFFPAGHCKGVCIGGYLLQGGYGWNGRKTGLACESVIGLDIITAEGELIHANENENADMYWAARGSGAGFFGVVICFYLKLIPLPKYRAFIAHDFKMKHLEDVYNWVYEVGPSIPKAVEFQLIMSSNVANLFGPGLEAFAPIFADTEDEYHEAMQFMINSPIKNKAFIATPALNPGINFLYSAAASHYPENSYWGVDNMWTHSSLDELMPYIKEISRTLPPAPSHFLWLNWHPNPLLADMAYSNEDKIYLALYGTWKNSADTAKYGDWAANMMQKMSHLSTGIQLADEGLHKRPGKFLSEKNYIKLQEIRKNRDPHNLFHEWHSRL